MKDWTFEDRRTNKEQLVSKTGHLFEEEKQEKTMDWSARKTGHKALCKSKQ